MNALRALLLASLAHALAACTAPAAPEEHDSFGSQALSMAGVVECPWGVGQCTWPGAGVPAGALHVGVWSTGTGRTTKYERADVATRFTMQGSAFPSEAVFSASREGAQEGVLTVEVRAGDGRTPDAGRLVARGRSMLRDAPSGAYAEWRVPLRVVAPVARLVDGTPYWLRVFVQQKRGTAPGSVWLDAAAPVPGSLLSGCAAAGSGIPSSCTTWTDRPGQALAWRPGFEDVASASCQDRIRNGSEAGRDCGAACGTGCALGAVCFQDADCGAVGVCRPAGIGPGRSDASCALSLGDDRETCSCVDKVPDNAPCAFDVDCVSGVCQGYSGVRTFAPRCVPSSCRNGVKDAVEADVDCGGPCATRCAGGKLCRGNAECDGGYLCGGDRKPYVCVVAKSNGDLCRADWQCASGACVAKVCAPVGPPLARCDSRGDCDSGVCRAGFCGAPTYLDRVKNGNESDVDCGGSGAGFKACKASRACRAPADCDPTVGLVCGPSGVCGAPLDVTCTKDGDCLSGRCARPFGAARLRCMTKYDNSDPVHCQDQLLDNDETDVDCGGVGCAPCSDKLRCRGPGDCLSGVCSTFGQCAPPACNDGVKNGTETAVDCGGTKCGRCGAGTAVPDAASCASGVRADLGVCLAGTCFDGLQNGSETGPDCGGGYCPACADGVACKAATDCGSGNCSLTTRRCAPATNADRLRNGDETDVDCGGSSGKGCLLRKACRLSADCAAPNVCANGLCAPVTCANGLRDTAKGELAVDCGGGCGPCGPGVPCSTQAQCRSGVCDKAAGATVRTCLAPTTADRLKNGDETDVDCGGSSGAGCPYAARCEYETDCALDMVCLGGRCNFGTCGNTTVSRGAHVCGRMCASRCGEGASCRGSLDCAPGADCFAGQDGVLRCTTRRCDIGGATYKPGEAKPDDPCLMCDPDRNDWVPRAMGAACDDLDPRTFSDRCEPLGSASYCRGETFDCTPTDAEKCVDSKSVVPDGRDCEVDDDCIATGVDRQKSCVNGRCEGPSCRRALAPAGKACGSASGVCSGGGRCDGVLASCPAEQALVGVVCRPARDACDAAETCVLGRNDCPPDLPKLAGDPCSDSGLEGLCVARPSSLDCVACQPGERFDPVDARCLPCPAGTVSAGGTATECVNGVNCARNAAWTGVGTTCQACPVGSTSPGGAVSACTWCTTLQTWNKLTKACDACPAGSRSDGADSTECRPIDCLAGEFWSETLGSCATCAEGRWSPGGAVTACNPIDCPADHRWEASRRSCVACDVGLVSDGGYVTDCESMDARGLATVRIVPDVVAFNTIAVGFPVVQRVVLANRGTREDLVVSGLALSHREFSVAPAGGAVLPLRIGPEQRVVLEVRYAPVNEGADAATLLVTSNDAARPVVEVPVHGVGAVAPSCTYTLTPAASPGLSFGTVQRGDRSRLPLTLVNVGTTDCYVGAVEVDPLDTVFRLPDGALFGQVVPPGASLVAPVEFLPPATASRRGTDYAGTLRLSVGTSQASLVQQTVALAGRGADVCLRITPAAVDFGIVPPACQTNERMFTVYNGCGADVGVQSIVLGAGSSDFRLTATTVPVTLRAGRQLTFTASYQPAGLGRDDGVVELRTGQSVTGGRPYKVALTGATETDGRVVETFVQANTTEADILFVVDDSGSMQEWQDKLATNFASFMSFAQQQGSDYRIGVTTSSTSSGCRTTGVEDGRLVPLPGTSTGPRVVVPGLADPAAAFARNVNVGTEGCPTEMGLEGAYLALSEPNVNESNAGFLRPGAALAVVIVSDAPDQSPRGADFYVDFFRNLKGPQGANQVSVSAIAWDAVLCPVNRYEDDPTDVYADVVRRTGGVFDVLCTDNWAASLQRLGQNAFGRRARFMLTSDPDPATVVVKVNGVTMARGTAWTYGADTRSVDFAAASVPPVGASVEVLYGVACH